MIFVVAALSFQPRVGSRVTELMSLIESTCDPVSTFLNHLHNRIPNGGEFSGLQFTHLICNKAAVRGEKFAGTDATDQPERAAREIRRVQSDGLVVAVGFAGDLAENPIARAQPRPAPPPDGAWSR